MTYYFKTGTSYRVSDTHRVPEVHEKLPLGTYIISQDMEGTFYLNPIDNYEMPGKLYGNTVRHSERILNTFMDRPVSTGVMLAGEKGSGKSLLAKMLSVEAHKMGISTIVINRPWCGDDFNKLLQDIDQPVVVLFDEFEKVYNSDQQEAILTLLDGMFPTKKLFVLTCNDKWRIDKHMQNRPGRIYYMLEFKGLDIDFIREYCEENLNNKNHVEGVCRLSGLFDKFNFDMLKALVEEMNRYNETAQEAMTFLNTKPEYSERISYTVQASVDGVPVDPANLSDRTHRGQPIIHGLSISMFNKTGIDSDGDDEGDWEEVRFTPNNLVTADGRSGKLVFQNGGVAVTLTRIQETVYDYSDYLG